jgi:hypothetical protein
VIAKNIWDADVCKYDGSVQRSQHHETFCQPLSALPDLTHAVIFRREGKRMEKGIAKVADQANPEGVILNGKNYAAN